MLNKQKQMSGHLGRFSLTALLITVTASIVFLTETSVHTYAICADNQTKEVQSFNDDSQEVVESAGFDSDDYQLMKETTDVDGVIHLELEKKFEVTINADGKQTQVQAIDETVSNILKQAGITLNEYDETEPTLDTVITVPQEIQVIRVTKETETAYSTIDYETQSQTTSELNRGQSRVVQKGISGQKQQTITVTYKNGVESDRKVISETVLKAPQTEIVEKGTCSVVVSRGGQNLRYSKVLEVTATAYSAQNGGVTTATGTRCVQGGTIAVDPSVIPLGSRVYVTSADGTSWVYGTAVAADTGGKIKGNKIDLYFNSVSRCMTFGVQKAKIYILK